MDIIQALSDMGFAPIVPGGPGVMRGPRPTCCEGTDRLAVWVETNTFHCRRCGSTVHDEIVGTCREADAAAVAAVLQDCMTRAVLEMVPSAPPTNLVECGVGKNWAEAK